MVSGLLVSLLLGCSDGTGPTGELAITAEGRLERGAIVSVSASLRGAVVPDSSVAWSSEPTGAVEFLAPGRARLLTPGEVTIRASARGEEGAIRLVVATPPAVVFDMLRDGNRDIYRVALDGRDTARITTHPGDDRSPTTAGGAIVFVSYRDGNGELYRVSLEGGTPVRLTRTPSNEADPALSRDGQRLAFTRSSGDAPKLWLANADGSEANRVTRDFGFAGGIEASPSWSPDADRLAFVSTAEGAADVFIYDVSDSSLSRLPGGSGFSAKVEPAWSPGGELVAFAGDRAGNTELYLVNIQTGVLTRLTDREGTDAQPGWVLDGRLVYSAWIDGMPELRWLDPTDPAQAHPIPVGSGEPQRPAPALR